MVSKRSILNLVKLEQAILEETESVLRITDKEEKEVASVIIGEAVAIPKRDPFERVILGQSILSDETVLRIFTSLQVSKIIKTYKCAGYASFDPLEAIRKATIGGSAYERSVLRFSDIVSEPTSHLLIETTISTTEEGAKKEVSSDYIVSDSIGSVSPDFYIAHLLSEHAPEVTRALWHLKLPQSLVKSSAALEDNKKMIKEGWDFSPAHKRNGHRVSPHWRSPRPSRD